jgi:hypothetical protein
MTAEPSPLSSSDRFPPLLARALLLTAATQVAAIPLLWITHALILDAGRKGIPTDFVNVWSAGVMVLQGRAAEAYDWALQKAVEVDALGRDFRGIYGWHYPPPFLGVAALLALLPYAVAHLVWPLLSFVPFAAAIRAIIGRPIGWIVAAGFPVVLGNLMVGQNGFLTAALVGGTLALLPTRPLLAGLCLGLLSYKPQYGLLFPLALVASGQWRCIAAAALTAIALALGSLALFGVAAWQAFVRWLPVASDTFLDQGSTVIWGKIQSVYSATRFLGGPERLAWALQGVVALAAAAMVLWLWRGRAGYAVKAAGLACGAVLATPYIFIYDLMVLAVAIAFLLRSGMQRGFLPFEVSGMFAALAMLLLFPLAMAPTGLVAALILSALVVRRAASAAHRCA